MGSTRCSSDCWLASSSGPCHAVGVSERDSERKRDVVFVAGKTGDALNVVRFRDEGMQLGELRTPREGEPIRGELVKLTERKESRRLFDVESVPLEVDAAPPRRGAGPAQVATRQYQRNWEKIFGKKNLPN